MALKEMTIPTAREAQERARARALDKRDQLCEISRALAVLAAASVRMAHKFVLFDIRYFHEKLVLVNSFVLYSSVCEQRA